MGRAPLWVWLWLWLPTRDVHNMTYNCMSSVPAFTALCLFSLNYISLTSQTEYYSVELYRDLSLRLFYIENRLWAAVKPHTVHHLGHG